MKSFPPVFRYSEGPAVSVPQGTSSPLLDTRAERTSTAIPAEVVWLYLAVGSLLVSGLFALMLVVGRMPVISGWITDPGFFRRCLVLHVNLSLLVWFSAFTAGLFALLPGMKGKATFAGGAAALGAVAMAVSAFIPGSEPVLSNYIPFIDHPIFVGGLILFLAGVAWFYLGGLLPRSIRADAQEKSLYVEARPLTLPAECVPGVLAAGVLFLVAVTTFFASWIATPTDLSPAIYYERIAWGGGHVLQVANVAAMVTVWLLLTAAVTGRRAVSPRISGTLFILLAAPHLAGPLLTWNGTATPVYLTGFTRLMQFGIFPVVTVFLAVTAFKVVAARFRFPRETGFRMDYRTTGVLLSIILTITGFILGAMIRGSTTMIPAHYHAATGAVTVAFMAMLYLMMEKRAPASGIELIRKYAPWQLVLYGFGQWLFALGFAVGGAFGLGRKEYGSEQVLYTTGEYIGAAIMGVGGLIAVAGGITFLVLAGKLLLWIRDGRSASNRSA